MIQERRRELTPEDEIVYSLKPNTNTINQYSYNVIDVSFGSTYGFGILCKKKNKNILRALLGFEKTEKNMFFFLFFRNFKI